VSFLQDTASEILYPILPFFVTGVLGAPPAVLGAIEGLADGTASLMKAASGRLADVGRRRPLVAGGYSVSAFGKVLLAMAGAWPLVAAARFTDRIGKGLRGPPRDAIIADETTDANRGRAFGFHRAADTAGAVAGPLIGLGLYHALGERFRPLLWIAVIPAVLSVAAVFLIAEPRRGELKRAQRTPISALPHGFWRVLGCIGLFSLVNFPDTLLLLRASDLGYGFQGVTGLYVMYNLSYAALSYPAGSLSDRLGRRRLFAAGLAMFAVAYVGLGLVTDVSWLWLLFPIYGAYSALTDGVSRAWVAGLVPADARGTALGLHAAVSGVGLLIAGIWAGLSWGDAGRVPLLISGAATAVLAIGLAVLGSHLSATPATVHD
jgi:MFS family permease